MPTVYMMIGIPCSGKSTFIDQNDVMKLLPSVSTDRHIERIAFEARSTYDDVFHQSIKEATREMNADIDRFVSQGISFIWDQTNLTKKSRAGKLSRIPNNWNKVAVYLEAPDDIELDRRLKSRPGKTIPDHVMQSMKSIIEPPNLVDEPYFDRIISNVNMDQYQI